VIIYIIVVYSTLSCSAGGQVRVRVRVRVRVIRSLAQQEGSRQKYITANLDQRLEVR
jgi:hypothetical protein